MKYQIQIHFQNKGQYLFEYEPDEDEHINDFILRYDSGDKFHLTGDENSTALINMDTVASIIAYPLPIVHKPEKVVPYPEM
jgi:hypothetical protein